MRIDFVRISPDAITPIHGSPGADGYDLHSVEEVIVRPNSARLILVSKFHLPILEKFIRGIVSH